MNASIRARLGLGCLVIGAACAALLTCTARGPAPLSGERPAGGAEAAILAPSARGDGASAALSSSSAEIPPTAHRRTLKAPSPAARASGLHAPHRREEGSGDAVRVPPALPPSAATGGSSLIAGNGLAVPARADLGDDALVARRLKRAAEVESDPVLKRKLWREYVNYANNLQQK